MNGFPRTINNKHDIANLMPYYEIETKAYLQNAFDNKDQWLLMAKLDISDTGISDDTHKVEFIYEQDEATGKDTEVIAEKYQYEFLEDTTGEIYRLGYANSGEVEALLMSVVEPPE